MNFKPAGSALALSLMILTGCSKNVDYYKDDAAPLYQTYNVVFDKTKQTTDVKAIFYSGSSAGDAVQLSNGANVRVNGERPTIYPRNTTEYYWSFDSIVKTDIILTKNSGKQLENVADISEVTTFDFVYPAASSYSRANGINFYWEGPPLAADESVLAEIYTIGSNLMVKDYASATTQDEHVTIAGTSLMNFPTNEDVYLSISRVRRMPVEASDENASGTMTVALKVDRTIRLY